MALNGQHWIWSPRFTIESKLLLYSYVGNLFIYHKTRNACYWFIGSRFFHGKMKRFSLFNKTADWVTTFTRYTCRYFCNISMLCSLAMPIVLYHVKIINIIFIHVRFITSASDVILNICGFVRRFTISRFCRNDAHRKKGDLYGVRHEVMWCIPHSSLVLYGHG